MKMKEFELLLTKDSVWKDLILSLLNLGIIGLVVYGLGRLTDYPNDYW